MAVEPTETGFAQVYNVELLLERNPEVRKAELLEALRARCGRVEPLDGKTESALLAFAYPDHLVTLADAVGPAQSFIAFSSEGVKPEKVEPDLQQSWNWPGVRDVLPGCRATALVTDFMSSALPYKERLALFHQTLLAVLDVLPCLAIHWVPSQQFIQPDQYRASKQPDQFDPVFPAINIRLFNIQGRKPGETLMDSIGLAALGIPDLQCHFGGLDVNDVARMLHNTAYYLFEKGDVIRDGETLQGVRPEDRWRCQHEESLVEPRRVVLDVDPGPSFAAGTRHR